jgi:hypothetical protein
MWGYSLSLHNTPGISDMCGVKNLKGAPTGGFEVHTINGVVSLDGAEGITSAGVNIYGRSIQLYHNPILTSAIALTNTEYPAGTLHIGYNPNLECVPSAWPAEDINGHTIPHTAGAAQPHPHPLLLLLPPLLRPPPHPLMHQLLHPRYTVAPTAIPTAVLVDAVR